MTAAAAEADPTNRLLSRGPRFRLDGEVIRDSALAAGGLLVQRMGGAPVKPYQPDGLWKAVAHASKTAVYKCDTGENLYRRSIYTFWKRAAPPPTMQIFDAPNRDSCAVSRDRTNTPLQALLTMNDVQFVEAARHMAVRAIRRQRLDHDRIEYLFRLVVSRPPTQHESAVLGDSITRFRDLYRQQPDLAGELIDVGESPAPADPVPAELAAWTMLCNQLMNLDEFVMKE